MDPKSHDVTSAPKPRLLLLERTDPTWADASARRAPRAAPTRRMAAPEIDRLLRPETEATGRYAIVFGRAR